MERYEASRRNRSSRTSRKGSVRFDVLVCSRLSLCWSHTEGGNEGRGLKAPQGGEARKDRRGYGRKGSCDDESDDVEQYFAIFCS